MVTIRKIDCPKDKYNIKCPYEMKPEFVVIHNTANNASANNEIAYMHRNNNEVSFHFAVDDKEIIQGLPLNRNSWNAGDGGSGKGNRKGISIEICYSKSGGQKFEVAQKNAAELTAKLLKDYGWGIDKVKKHQDFNGKYCPHRTLSDYGWDYFLNLVKGYMKPATTTTTTTTNIKKGSLVSIKSGATYYNGKKIPSWVIKQKWIVVEVEGDRAVVNMSENGKYSINSPIAVKNLVVVAKSATPTIKVGSTVKLNKGAKTYDGKSLSSFVYGRKYKVKELKSNRAVITYLGITVAAVNVKDLTLA
jgi:N-acetylmuramoyl-L-alanine amidase CwlA